MWSPKVCIYYVVWWNKDCQSHSTHTLRSSAIF